LAPPREINCPNISAAPLTAPVALALAAFLLLNQVRFGSPWEFSQAWQAGAFIDGAFGSLFPGRCGYLIVAPAILAAFAAWPCFFRAHPRDAVVLASGILLPFSVYASFGAWAGASAYAARHYVPLLPLIFIPLVKLPETGKP